MPEPDPISDLQPVYLTEFERLRDEIDNRTQVATNLVIAEITALGAGISFFDKVPEVLIGLSIVSSLLWLLWLDQALQIYKIAAYIGCKLADKLQREDNDALGWESFLRVLDKGGRRASRELFGNTGTEAKLIDLPPTRNIGRYMMLLFGGPPVAFVSIYVYMLDASPPATRTGLVIRIAGIVVAITAWLFSLRQHRFFNRAVGVIDEALLLKRDPGHP